MKANKSVREEKFTQGKDLQVDPRKSFNIQIEYNVPFSKLHLRCEKENINSNQDEPLESRTLKEEEDAIAREKAKKKQADDFFKKIQENSKKILQQKKKDKTMKEQEKQKEQERILFKTSKPRILPVKKSPKKKNPVPTENPVTDSLLEASMQSKALTEQSVSQEISNLSAINPQTALQRNEIIRNHMAMISKRLADQTQSSINLFKTDRE